MSDTAKARARISPLRPAQDGARLRRWLPYSRPDAPNAKLRFLCFAHAGGSALVFHKWPAAFPEGVQVCPVQLPGRERRLNEPLIKRIPELVEELWHALLPVLDRPVALLGHSLGARIAFEFARRLESQAGAPAIRHLFVSGCRAPHLPLHDPMYDLPHDEFLRRLKGYGGTPKELLADPEFMEFLLPRLRADFELNDTYTFAPGTPLACPITAWGGDVDVDVPVDSIEAWREHTRGPFRSQVLPGAHFAIYERENEIFAQIIQELAPFL